MAKTDEGAEAEADDTVADSTADGGGSPTKGAGTPTNGSDPVGEAGPYVFPTWLRFVIFLVCTGAIVAAGLWADPGAKKEVDRVMFWTFIIFSVGLAELFLLFIGLAIFGSVDLTTLFQDKSHGTGAGSLSLARLQAFLWTLIVLVTYFHEAVTDNRPGLPTIPSELILVMGISGATYLASKQIAKPGESQ
jgi:hypothetical protein